MSFVANLGPHLPFLRRYARALTGSQESGDAYIRASLMALSEDPSSIDEKLEPRIALYRFFHAIWGSTGARLDEPRERALNAMPDRRLQALAPAPRQAFLLTAMEGFKVSEAAVILDMDVESTRRLIDEAQRDIESELSTTVLVIEDEPVIAADLEALVAELGHQPVGNATTRDEAVAMAKQHRPGLILCDIQLADNSSGVDAINDILQELEAPVIFITAFPQRLLTGERPEPTYLITKPFQETSVKAAIGQALFFHGSKAPAAA